MGAWMSRVWFLMFPAREYKLVVVGLDNAGKTTTLYKLHLGEAVTAAPTIGSNVEEVVFKNLRFEVRDPSSLSFLVPPCLGHKAAGFAPRSPPDRA
jgi:ADP-ribosylation factor-like protein 5B